MKKTILFSSIFATCFIIACKKTETIPDRFTAIPSGNTNIKFINLSPDAPSVNFFANGLKSTSTTPSATNAVTGLGYAGFYPSVAGYTTFSSGTIKLDAKVPDSSTVMPGATILTASQAFDPNKYYTVALVDSIGSTPGRLAAVISEDDPSVPDPSKAYVRISNYIANGAIKVEITKTSTDYAYSKTYASVPAKTVLPFDSIGAGKGQVYKVLLRNAATDARLDSIVGFTPSNTKKYTLYARGVMGLTGTNTRRPLILSYVNF